MLTKELIKYSAENSERSMLINELQRLIAWNSAHFDCDVADALYNVVDAMIEDGELSAIYSDWITSLAESQHALPRYLYARFLARNGAHDKAINLLATISGTLPSPDPFLLLYLTRLLVRAKRFREGAEILKTAISLNPPYSFFVKSEKILGKIISSGKWTPRRTIRLALLGSSTTTFLAPVLIAITFKDDIKLDMYESEFGNFRQEILNPASGLYSFKPEAVVLILNHRDLALLPIQSNHAVSGFITVTRNLWAVLQRQNPCHIVQIGIDLPPYGSWGYLEEIQPGGRSRLVSNLNLLLSENLPNGVSFCDVNRIIREIGSRYSSDIEWLSAKQYPALDALPLFSSHVGAHLRAAFGLSSKVLVLDLDNTLWGGVIGEDGISGIILGPPSPEGEGYLELQHFLKELKSRGILLAVCSKNNREDAELPFLAHDSMILKLDDFVIFTANWEDKATSIRNMAEALSLGLDSFVFIDDNPLERAWVRANLPEVIVPECGAKPWQMLRALRQGMFFEALSLTTEDSDRHNSYASNIARKEFEQTSATLDDFLSSLEMVAESGPVDSVTLKRVAQLTNKTNQFNLTTKRYTEEQVRAMSDSPLWWMRWYRLKDKFGDHGLIGVIFARKDRDAWHIDTLLMSCRVLGRKMEGFMCADLLQSASAEGAHKVYGEYIPTAKNSLVKDMLANNSFSYSDDDNRYVFDLTSTSITFPEYIQHTNKLYSDSK